MGGRVGLVDGAGGWRCWASRALLSSRAKRGILPASSMLAEKIPRFARDDMRARDDAPRHHRLAPPRPGDPRRDQRRPPRPLRLRRAPRAHAAPIRRQGPRAPRPAVSAHRGRAPPRCARRSPRCKARRPMAPLRWSKGLAAAAADHVRDQGPIGGLEHRGTDGSDPARRASRHGRWVQGMAENIAYGENPAREVVIQLLVDDGVPGPRPPRQHPGPGLGRRRRRLRTAPASIGRCA